MLAAPLNDITARHLAKVVESSDDAIISKNLDSVIQTWNPAANGCSATPRTRRSIRARIRRDPEEVCITVADTGAGIEPAFLT